MAPGSNATIAILMTDMVGSTRQWEADREGMWAATRLHDQIAGRIVESRGGKILKARGEGDSLLILFPTAHDAVLAAIDLNLELQAAEWPTGIDIRVRAAIHVGDMVHGEHDVYGPTPNRCARIRSLAGARQILISEVAFNLARAATGPQVGYQDRGQHRLKDLSRPERIYQIIHDGLPEPGNDLLSLGAVPNNLPIQVSRFVGRSADIARVSDLVHDNRLVSLTGLSGIGKSRLALQVGADLIDDFPGGAWYVDLHDVEGRNLIPEVAACLEVSATNVGDVSGIVTKLGGRPALFILDHCDRIPGFASSLTELLAAIPNAHFVLASQDRLGLSGEARYRVPLLEVDGGGEPADASLLFLDRARLLRPELEASAANLQQIDRIVRRLEGLPLAIELAAARVGVLSLEQVAKRLEENFRLISSSERGLSLAFQESIDSLDATQAALLPRLAVFEGTTFGAFEQFCSEDGLDEIDLLDALQVLIDRSLIDFHDWLAEPRYQMLNSIREHVLASSTEEDRRQLADRHADLFSSIVDAHFTRLGPSDIEETMIAIGPDYGNIRAALRRIVERGDAVKAQRLAAQLFRYWEARGMVVEGRELCEAALTLGTTAWTDEVHNAAGNLSLRQGEFEAGRRHHLEALALRKQLGKEREIVGTLNNLANLESDQGNLDEAQRLYDEALHLNRQSGNRRWEAINLVNLGTLAHRQGRYEDAVDYHRQSLAVFEQAGVPGFRRFPLIGLGNALIRLERYPEARDALTEALRVAELSDDQAAKTVSLEGLGTHDVATGDFERGVRLLAQARRLREDIQLPLNPQDEAEIGETLEAARSGMGRDAFDRAWTQGGSMPVEPGSA